MSKFNKLLGAYLCDLGEDIASKDTKICPELMGDLISILSKLENSPKEENIIDKAEKDILSKRQEMTPEECLACELLNMLGLKDDVMSMPGEHISSIKPTVKIRIKKVSSKDDLNKILKELKTGGSLDLNTVNDSLGEIFDLNSIQEIMETPMFKEGGLINNQTTLSEFLNE